MWRLLKLDFRNDYPAVLKSLQLIDYYYNSLKNKDQPTVGLV